MGMYYGLLVNTKEENSMLKRHKVISVYIFAHFVVDFACAFMIFRIAYDSGQWLTCLLIYNFCAFALQMPIGLIADRWNRNALLSFELNI